MRIRMLLVILAVGLCSAVTINDFAHEWLAEDSYADRNKDGIVNYLDIGIMAEHKIIAWSGEHWGTIDTIFIQGDIRNPISAPRRTQEIVDAGNSFSAEIALNMGDIVDIGVDPDDNTLKLGFLQSRMAVVTDSVTGFQCPRADSLGNHIAGFNSPPTYSPIWDGVDGSPTIDDYFTEISAQTSGFSITKENFFGDGGNPYGYTFDFNSITYICFYSPGTNDASQDSLDWLTARLEATLLPVVIFSHVHLWEDPNHIRALSWSLQNFQDFFDIVDVYPLVQMVIGGHDHINAWHYVRNDIHYLGTGGSTGVRTEYQADGTNNNYIKITLEPQIINTPNGLKANCSVDGVGLYSHHASRGLDIYGGL